MKFKLLIIMCMIFGMVVLVSSAPPFQSSSSGLEIRNSFPQSIKFNTTHDVHVHVFNMTTGLPVIDDLSCYIHLYTLDGHHLFEGIDSTASHDFDYAWDVDAGNFTELGELIYIMQCNNTNEGGFYSSSTFITPTGEILTEGQGVSFTGILISMIALAFFFVYLSLKLVDKDETFPAGLFFLLIGILISVQTIYMGAVYSRDYLSTAIANPQMDIFLAMIYSLVGIAFISLTFFTIKVIKELKERKSMVDYGDYYDSQSKQYK